MIDLDLHPPWAAFIAYALVGALCGKAGMEKVEPFFVSPFQGVLALFDDPAAGLL